MKKIFLFLLTILFVVALLAPCSSQIRTPNYWRLVTSGDSVYIVPVNPNWVISTAKGAIGDTTFVWKIDGGTNTQDSLRISGSWGILVTQNGNVVIFNVDTSKVLTEFDLQNIKDSLSSHLSKINTKSNSASPIFTGLVTLPAALNGYLKATIGTGVVISEALIPVVDTANYARDIDSTKKVPVVVKNGYFSMFDNNSDLIGSDYTPTILAESLNVWRDATTGQNLVDRLPIMGTEKTIENPIVTVDERYRITSIIPGSGGSGGLWGVDQFSATDSVDTIMNANIDEGDIIKAFPYSTSPSPSPLVGDGDMWCYTTTGKIISLRPTASVSSNVKYYWERKAIGGGFNPLGTIDSGATIYQWYTMRKETPPSGDSIITITDWSLNSNDLTTAGIRKAKYTTGGSNNQPFLRLTGRKDSSYYISPTKNFTWMTGIDKKHTLLYIIQPDSFMYYNGGSIVYAMYHAPSYNYIGHRYLSALVRWDWEMATMDMLPEPDTAVYGAVRADTTGWGAGTKPVILMCEFDTCDGDANARTMKLYVNSNTYTFRTVIQGDTVYSAHQWFVLGAYKTGSPANYFAGGKFYEGFGISGIMTASDKLWLLRKMDELFNTGYTP